MKILAKIKGFITNSSSANYWLNDGVLEEGELPEKPTSTDKYRVEYYEKKSQEQSEYNLAMEKRETLSDFILWAIFSLILVIVFIIKKTGKK